MTPERWKQIDELAQAALEHSGDERSSFLDAACAGDDVLRGEVESQIAYQQQASKFLEEPAFKHAAELMADPQTETDSMEGRTISHYSILRKLGAGGMGDVYLAQDTTLSRKVAIKFLSQNLVAGEQARKRFVREAKAAASLDHPHICAVYEVGEEAGYSFIVMQYVEGETLACRLQRQRLELPEALKVATQVADALAEAHRHGIIHRDIKPQNIMVTPRGQAKVMDFGLAKIVHERSLAESEAEAASFLTEPGVILGTAPYMAPEQVRCEMTDLRSDIFSFGAVLYEIVTGHQPFSASSAAATFSSILTREPPSLSRYSGEVPAELERIVRKTLRKDREERYQTAGDLLIDLNNLKHSLEFDAESERSRESLSGGGDTRVASAGRMSVATANDPVTRTGEIAAARTASSAEFIVGKIRRHKRALFVVSALSIFVLAALSFGIYRYATRSLSSASMKLTKLTTDGKAGASVAISLDGRYVVHTVNGGGGTSFWLRQVATSSSVQIVPPSDKWFQGVTFSPDGNYIYYVAVERNNPAGILYQTPVLGGVAKKVVEDLATPVTISPDGKQAAFIRSDIAKAEDSLIIASLDGARERKLVTRKPPNYFVTDEGAPAWSPDGTSIVYAGYVYGSGTANEINVFEVNIADGAEKAVPSAHKWDWIDAIAWLRDGSGFLLTASELGAQGFQIWELSKSGQAHRITNDLGNYSGIDLTADSNTMVTTQHSRTSNIWIAPGGDSSRARQITSGTSDYTNFDWTPDDKIVFVARAQSSREIWVMDADGSGQKQLTSGFWNGNCSVCAGGHIVFSSSAENGQRIWRMDIDGSNQIPLTMGKTDYSPTCSPDGKWVVYSHNSFGVPMIWKVPIDGGDAVQLTDRFSQRPMVSPDGKLIVVSRYLNDPASRKFGMALIPFEGGEPVKLFDILTSFVLWSRDGHALHYIYNRGSSSNVWSQPIDGTPAKQLTDFKSDKLFSFAWSTDGKQLAVSRGADAADVVLISNFR